MAYTEKQISTIEYLISRGKAIHKKLENPGFGERKKLEDELKAVKKDLNTALNAEAMFRAHLRVAEEHIAAAEALRNEWITE